MVEHLIGIGCFISPCWRLRRSLKKGVLDLNPAKDG